MGDIHACMGFFMSITFFLVFTIETEKFCFKYLLEEGFLWSEEKIDEYTKGCQEKNEEYTKYLKYDWMRTVRNIADNPYDEAEPDQEKIDDHAPEEDIRIDQWEKRKAVREIHIFDYR